MQVQLYSSKCRFWSYSTHLLPARKSPVPSLLRRYMRYGSTYPGTLADHETKSKRKEFLSGVEKHLQSLQLLLDQVLLGGWTQAVSITVHACLVVTQVAPARCTDRTMPIGVVPPCTYSHMCIWQGEVGTLTGSISCRCQVCYNSWKQEDANTVGKKARNTELYKVESKVSLHMPILPRSGQIYPTKKCSSLVAGTS